MYNNYLTDEDEDLICNSSARIPLCLCIDVSGSMFNKDNQAESRLTKVRKGISKLYSDLRKNPSTKDAVEVAVVAFETTARVYQPFKVMTAINEVPFFNGGGKGDIGVGVKKALELLEDRKQQYKNNGVDYYQPWLIVMSDGRTTNDDQKLAEQTLYDVQNLTREMEENKKLTILTVLLGKDERGFDQLSKFSNKNETRRIDDNLDYTEFFEWLGKSVAQLDIDISDIEFPETSDWDDI